MYLILRCSSSEYDGTRLYPLFLVVGVSQARDCCTLAELEAEQFRINRDEGQLTVDPQCYDDGWMSGDLSYIYEEMEIRSEI